MYIKDHYIIAGKEDLVEYKECEKNSGVFEKGLPDTIVMHYTAGSGLASSVQTLVNPEIKASAHIVIGRDAKVVQLVPFNKIAWHAGNSSWKDRTGLNNYSIGIELDNAGKLSRQENFFISWFNKKYGDEEVAKAVHPNEDTYAYWHIFTEEQINTAFKICALLVNNYNIQWILGHDEIAPKRKIDPGPLFPIEKFKQHLIEETRDKNEDETEEKHKGEVVATKLNIRESPDTTSKKVALPLTKGTHVKIIDRKGNWYKVKTQIEGWVFADYIA